MDKAPVEWFREGLADATEVIGKDCVFKMGPIQSNTARGIALFAFLSCIIPELHDLLP